MSKTIWQNIRRAFTAESIAYCIDKVHWTQESGSNVLPCFSSILHLFEGEREYQFPARLLSPRTQAGINCRRTYSAPSAFTAAAKGSP